MYYTPIPTGNSEEDCHRWKVHTIASGWSFVDVLAGAALVAASNEEYLDYVPSSSPFYP